MQCVTERGDLLYAGPVSESFGQPGQVRAADRPGGEVRPLDDLAERPLRQQAASDDESESMTPLGLIHVVRGDQERQPLTGESMNLLPEVTACLGVHAGCGLVEQQQSGPVNQARGQGQPLLPTAGELTGKLVLPLRQTESRDALTHRVPAVLQGIHARDEIQVLCNRQILPETETLGHVADLTLDGLTFADDIKAEACAAAFIRTEQAAEHADDRRLAAAVRAEKAADLARANLQAHVVDGREVAETLGHPVHVDGEILSHKLCLIPTLRGPIARPPAGRGAAGPPSRARRPLRS